MTRAEGARYAHTNLIARDWRGLSAFYREVFGCVPLLPEREQSGEWLERGTGVSSARLAGVHLRLPGHGEGGPTLEIFSYSGCLERTASVPNRLGYGHIAFAVDDVPQALEAVLAAGGSRVGEIVSADVPGAGRIEFTYARDPEGNIVELQRWYR
jgi:predicted enzyme related to lactoylglutathione lyase